jgi:hypothetical protein
VQGKKMLSYLINKKKLIVVVKNGAGLVPTESPQSLQNRTHSRDQRLFEKV